MGNDRPELKEAECVEINNYPGCERMFRYDPQFYKDKGLSEPKRCKSCRQRKKAERGN